MKNFKFKERQELLEQKIQEYYKDNSDIHYKSNGKIYSYPLQFLA